MLFLFPSVLQSVEKRKKNLCLFLSHPAVHRHSSIRREVRGACGPYGYLCLFVLLRFRPWVLSESWVYRIPFAEEPQQQKDKTNKAWNRKDAPYSCSACAWILPCLCESCVFWPYLGSFTINRWVGNSVYVVSGGGGGSWSRGKHGEKRQRSSTHTIIYLSIPRPVSFPLHSFSPPPPPVSPPSHHCPTCSFFCTSLHLH